MKRNYIYALLLTLLIMLPIGLSAQSVTGMQYWFDDGSKHTTSISEGGNNLSLSTDGLSVGMHTLYYRFTQSGGDIVWEDDITDVETGEVRHDRIYYTDLEYSPVYSVRFFKHDPSEGSTVEYWFDKKSSHATTDISGAEGETVTLDLADINMFPLGFHQLNMRFSTPGKSPSAIYTADVMKFSAGSRYLQYWVDDKYSPESPKVEGKVMTAHLDDGKTRDDVVFSSTQLPLTDVSPGLHHLYYRTCDANGVAGSAVYSAIIFRHAEEASQIEYWFDDDASTIQRKQFAEAYQNGATYTIDLTPDVFPQGLHQLNIRVSTKNSGMSAIYSTPVVKMDANSFSTVEFWLDNDRENVQTISGSLSSNGVAIVGDLDFSGADPGMHYLHYRAIGKDGKPSNAVGEWPVMVKSRYNRDPSEAKIAGYSFSVDNGSADIYLVPKETREWTIEDDLDMRTLSQGTHTLHFKAYNDFGGMTAVDSSFTVGAMPEPHLTLAARADENGVHLTANALANDIDYKMYRKQVGYFFNQIWGMQESYPLAISHTDHPKAGNYVYYIEGWYKDKNGERKKLKSDEVTVSVPTPKNDIAYGTIEGSIKRELGTLWGDYDVYVEMNLNNGEDIRRSRRTGEVYYFEQVPEGAQVTLSVKGDKFADYEDVTFTVDYGNMSGSPYATQTVNFKGTLNDYAAEVSGSYDYALKLASPITWEHNQIKFDVKSLRTSYTSWGGYVYAYAIEKAVADKNGLDASEVHGVYKSIRLDCDKYVSIRDGNTQSIRIPLKNIGKLRKDKEYYFAFFTSGSYSGNDFYNSIKPLALDDGVADENGYVVHTLEKKDYGAEESIREDDAIRLANMLVKLSCKVDGLDGHFGDLSSYYDVVREAAKSIGSNSESQDFEKLVEYMGKNSPFDLLDNKLLEPLCTGVDYLSPMVSMVRDKLTPYCKTAEGFTTALTMLKEIKHTVSGRDFYEKFFSCAKAIMYLGSKYTTGQMGAVCTDIGTYIEIGMNLAEAARQLGEAYFAKYEVSYWKENGEASNVEDHNKHFDFKIKVKKGRKTINFSDYSTQELGKMIDFAKVHFTTYKASGTKNTHTVSTRLVGVKDGIMLRQTSITSEGTLDDIDDVGRMWLEIKWANGRTSLIPLMKDGKFGIDYEEISNRYTYTVNFKTENKALEHIADELHLDD